MELKDKVVIDNVDVSECKHFLDDDNIPIIGHLKNFCFYNHDRCEIFNCEFKRKAKNNTLEKLKEENEKLKQYLLNIGMIIEELEQQYDDIKDFTEIKEIKEILKEAL